MKIKKITFDNFRSYKGRNEFNLTDVNVLIGPNNAGKSNLIRSLEIYRELNLGKHSIGQDQRHTGARNEVHRFEIEFILDESEVAFLNLYEKEQLINHFQIKDLKHEIVFDPFVRKESLCFKDVEGKWIPIFSFEKLDQGVQYSALSNSSFSNLEYKWDKGQYADLVSTGFLWLTRLELASSKTNYLIKTSLQLIISYMGRWRYLQAFRNASHKMNNIESSILSSNGDNLVAVLNYLQMNDSRKHVHILEMINAANEDIDNFTAPTRSNEIYGLIREKGDVTIEL